MFTVVKFFNKYLGVLHPFSVLLLSLLLPFPLATSFHIQKHPQLSFCDTLRTWCFWGMTKVDLHMGYNDIFEKISMRCVWAEWSEPKKNKSGIFTNICAHYFTWNFNLIFYHTHTHTQYPNVCRLICMHCIYVCRMQRAIHNCSGNRKITRRAATIFCCA